MPPTSVEVTPDWKGSPMKVHARRVRCDTVRCDRPALVIESQRRQVEPRVVRLKAGAPDDAGDGDDAAVIQLRISLGRPCDSADSLDAHADHVRGGVANQRLAARGDHRPGLAAERCVDREHVMEVTPVRLPRQPPEGCRALEQRRHELRENLNRGASGNANLTTRYRQLARDVCA